MARVLLAMPTHYGMVHSGAMRAATVYGSEQHELKLAFPASSLLPKTFNVGWTTALRQAEDNEIDYFAMLHDDIVPEPGWLDRLIDELERTECDVLSCVVPIKDGRGITSTALATGDPADVWHIEKRLSMTEVMDLPETFTAADCGYPDRALLINSGCWVCRIQDARFRQVNERGELDFSWQIHCRVVVQDDGRYQIQMRSEDWEFGRWLWANDFDVRATRCVSLEHFAQSGYPNDRAWGTRKGRGTVAMFVRVLKRYRALRPNVQCELPDGVANVLIKRGIVEKPKPKRKPKAKPDGDV